MAGDILEARCKSAARPEIPPMLGNSQRQHRSTFAQDVNRAVIAAVVNNNNVIAPPLQLGKLTDLPYPLFYPTFLIERR